VNTIWKSIVSISSIFSLISILAETPNSIEVLGMQISVSNIFLLVLFILTIISTVGIVNDTDQSKAERYFFSIIGAISAVILCRLWLFDISIGKFFIGFFVTLQH